MSDGQNFFESSERMFNLYRQERYADALAAAEELAKEFPEQKTNIVFWEICLLSCSGRVADALTAMSHALEDGLWWSEAQLRNDGDLAPLQGLPEFEKMMSQCKERQAAAQGSQTPVLEIFEPETKQAGCYPLLIALHGRGSSVSLDKYFWMPVTKLGWLLALPQSSQLGSPNSYIWDDAEITEAEIVAHFAEIIQKYPIDLERVVLAGFSQGAARAIHLAVKGAIRARGFLAVVPGKVLLDNLEALTQAAKDKGLRGYLVSGGKDPRYEIIQTAHKLFNENKVACAIENHPDLGHEFPKNFQQSIQKAMEFIFKEQE
jgi:predicted esterase